MSNLAPQKINLSYSGLLQVPGGLTSSLQYITDGNGVSSGLQISTTGFSGTIVSDTVTITGGTINGTAIGATNPSSGRFSSLTVSALTGLLKGSSGAVSTATANTDYLTPPSGTAILKANSGGALANATSGVDYAPATSGSSVLSGNGSGGFTNVSIGPGLTFVGSTISTTTGLDNTKLLASNGLNGFSSVTVGSGLQYSGGVLASTSGGGSVTTVSVVTANGFAGTVANASSTPAITLTTSVTGLLKGNGTAISAATSGTDYAPATSGTAILKGNGSGGFSSAAAGSDYLAPPSGTSILKANSGGALANAVAGTDYSAGTSSLATGILKSTTSTGALSIAVAGTDYPGLATANTFTANQTVSGNLTASALIPSGSTIPTNGLYLPTTNTLAWSTNSTERLRLDSSGNLGLGVTPSGWVDKAIQVTARAALSGNGNVMDLSNNAYKASGGWTYVASGVGSSLYEQYNGTHAWSIAPSGTAGNTISFTQAMTLDASGNLLVGTTSDLAGNNAIGQFNQTTASRGAFVAKNVTSTNDCGLFWNAATSGNNTFIGFYTEATITSRGSITYNRSGGLVAYNTSSDQRLKENIADAPSALASVNAIKVRSFDWKSDGSHVDYGYIAQELLEVVPEAVHVPADPEEMMGVDFGKLTPRLVKAIQEIAARLDALEAK